MQPVDINKLGSIIDVESETATERILYRDTFAVACYLHLNGQEAAALKLCRTLFDHLGRNRRSTYFAKVTSNLPGNERTYASAIAAHLEINDLFSPKRASA
jgi:hypothetical protein